MPLLLLASCVGRDPGLHDGSTRPVSDMLYFESVACTKDGAAVIAGDEEAAYVWRASDGLLLRSAPVPGLRVVALGAAPTEWQHGHEATIVLVSPSAYVLTLGLGAGELVARSHDKPSGDDDTVLVGTARGVVMNLRGVELSVHYPDGDTVDYAPVWARLWLAYRLPGAGWLTTAELPTERGRAPTPDALVLLTRQNRAVVRSGARLFSALLAPGATWEELPRLPDANVYWVGDVDGRLCAIVPGGLTCMPFDHTTPLPMPLVDVRTAAIAGDFAVVTTGQSVGSEFHVITHVMRRDGVGGQVALDDFWDARAATCGRGVAVATRDRIVLVGPDLVVQPMATPPVR